MKPHRTPGADVLVATAATLLVSIGAGLLALLPLDARTPDSTCVVLFAVTACPLVIVCVVASGPWIVWSARRRARRARP